MNDVPVPLPMPAWDEDAACQAILDGAKKCQEKAEELARAMRDFEPTLYQALRRRLLESSVGFEAP